MADAPAVSGVREIGQNIEEGRGRRHGKASGFGWGFPALPAIQVSAKINY
jgi:hypothetical protein